MPVPSSLKFKKGEVVYEQSVDRANYFIEELTRAAMKDVGRFVLREVSKKVRAINAFTKNAKYVPKRYQMWVRKQENDLQLGIENTKYGAETAWWADQAELGTHGQPKRGILYSTVYDNIGKIREIEAHYLSSIEDELAAQSMIDEDEAQEAAE